MQLILFIFVLCLRDPYVSQLAEYAEDIGIMGLKYKTQEADEDQDECGVGYQMKVHRDVAIAVRVFVESSGHYVVIEVGQKKL